MNLSVPDKDFDATNPLSIYEYSKHLIGKTLQELSDEDLKNRVRKGKGGLGQMVEELFFGYNINSNREADFQEAKLELKCTPLLKYKDNTYRIKERLVCTMIDYFELVNTDFENSHLLSKCRLMLLLFYLHISGCPIYDFRFLFRVLWELPEKDLIQIKKDYETIAGKVREGKAHELSEGDTMYLGACRKGQKNDSPQSQPFSNIKANKRAFSLKPAYMRYVLNHVTETTDGAFSNYHSVKSDSYELVRKEELAKKSFEEIVVNRFKPFIGLNYQEICEKLNTETYQSKSKYADVCGLIASNGERKRITDSEEFIKSGIIMKTIRLGINNMPRESMSFKNIDYKEVMDNDEWVESEAYEIFTSRFMFVVFVPYGDKTITVHNRKTGKTDVEPSYVLEKVFFWTMPTEDLLTAEEYWSDIRKNVLDNNIHLKAFWNLKDNRKFHVRPKATRTNRTTDNPHGGRADKYCYWFNAAYVKNIIENSTSK